jgi:outer membrane protein TolC
MIMNHKFFLFLLLTPFWCYQLPAQQFEPLIRKCWDSDDQLKATHFELKSAEYAYKEAKAMYGPTAGFQAQYTRASGGRVIEFPIGDIINPVYSTLNVLTQSNVFPMLKNEEINFLPDNFYDARFRIQQPVYYPDLHINKALKAEHISLKQIEIKAYKRLLSREVMVAYINYNSLTKSLRIIESGDSLLSEVKRITESMIRNGIALPAALYRVNNEIATLKSKKAEAEASRANALAYIRQLTGDPAFIPDDFVKDLDKLPSAIIESGGVREETSRLDLAIRMNGLAIQKEEMFYIPRVGAVLDMGSQDFDFGWSPYVLFGLNFEVNLFDSKRNKFRKEQYAAADEAYKSRKNLLDNQLYLQRTVAFNNFMSTLEQASNYDVRLAGAKKFYADILSAYKAGSAGYLEMIDARNNLTATEIEKELMLDKAWVGWAEYVYASAAWPID